MLDSHSERMVLPFSPPAVASDLRPRAQGMPLPIGRFSFFSGSGSGVLRSFFRFFFSGSVNSAALFDMGQWAPLEAFFPLDATP